MAEQNQDKTAALIADHSRICHKLCWNLSQNLSNNSAIRVWNRWTGTLNETPSAITKSLFLGNVTASDWFLLNQMHNAYGVVTPNASYVGNVSDFMQDFGSNQYVYTLLHMNATRALSPGRIYANLYDMALYTVTGSSGAPLTKGLVSTTAGATPFYTTSVNPKTITLNASQCAVANWTVNSTGVLGTPYAFFAFANQTSNPANNARSPTINLTIS